MPHHDAHLLTLVNLLEDRLPVAEGVSVRERLASDAALFQHWRTLSKVIGSKTPLDDVDRLASVDMQTVAAFVDGRLNFDEAADFERYCWKNPTALREVVSVFRSVHTDVSSINVPTRFRQQMTDVVVRECGETEPANPVDATLTSPQKIAKAAAHRSPRPAANDRPPARPLRQTRSEQGKHRRGNKTPSSNSPKATAFGLFPFANHSGGGGRTCFRRLTVAGVALIGVLLLLVVYFAVRDHSSFLQSPVANNPSSGGNLRSPAQQDRNTPRSSHDITPRSPQTPNVVNNRDDGPDGSTPDNLTSTTPPTPIPVKYEPSPLKIRDDRPFVKIAWADVAGIVARRRDDSERWSGLLSSNQAGETVGPMTLRTLPQGWVRGRIGSARKPVVDSDSEIRISARLNAGTPDDNQLVIDLELRRGQAAITGLRQGDEVRSRHGDNEWTIRVDVDNTSVGLIRVGEVTRQVLVWAGSVHIEEKLLTAGHLVTWNGRIFQEPSNIVARHTWRRKPDRSLALSKRLTDRMNNSDDLLAALAEVNRSPRAADVALAANLGFALDPITTVPTAASSDVEDRRTAAIHWLLATVDGEPITRQVWRRIASSIDQGQTPLSVHTWFQAAQSKNRPTQKQLGELSSGLGPRQPLFVRQCAIHFLRQITRLPLVEYNPNQPTTASIKSVRQKTRRATSNDRRRTRNNQRTPYK